MSKTNQDSSRRFGSDRNERAAPLVVRPANGHGAYQWREVVVVEVGAVALNPVAGRLGVELDVAARCASGIHRGHALEVFAHVDGAGEPALERVLLHRGARRRDVLEVLSAALQEELLWAVERSHRRAGAEGCAREAED